MLNVDTMFNTQTHDSSDSPLCTPANLILMFDLIWNTVCKYGIHISKRI